MEFIETESQLVTVTFTSNLRKCDVRSYEVSTI
jgi:hypothetical protein